MVMAEMLPLLNIDDTKLPTIGGDEVIAAPDVRNPAEVHRRWGDHHRFPDGVLRGLPPGDFRPVLGVSGDCPRGITVLVDSWLATDDDGGHGSPPTRRHDAEGCGVTVFQGSLDQLPLLAGEEEVALSVGELPGGGERPLGVGDLLRTIGVLRDQ